MIGKEQIISPFNGHLLNVLDRHQDHATFLSASLIGHRCQAPNFIPAGVYAWVTLLFAVWLASFRESRCMHVFEL